MGVSATLLKKDFLELSLEIDRDVQIEISTGFGGSPRPQVVVSMPLDLAELDQVIERMQEWRSKIASAWKCPDCGLLNAEEHLNCNVCELPKNKATPAKPSACKQVV